MQRSTLPLLLLVLLVGAVVLYFRPVQLGDFVALAESWDLPAWLEGDTRPPAHRAAEGWVPGTPQRPTSATRPASWPGSPPPDPGALAGAAALPRQREDGPPLNPQAEYPDTGYPPYEDAWDGLPARQGVGPIDNPPHDVWSDPFGDRTRGPMATDRGGPAQPGWAEPEAGPPWPQHRGPASPAPGLQAPAPPVVDSSAVPCPGVEILARVGSDVVFAREVSMGIAELREKNKGAVPASVLEQNIRELLKKRVEKRVEEKLICQDAQRKAPKDKFAKILDHYSKVFDKYQVPEMMKRMNLGSQRELEEALRRAGVSLEIYKRAFIEEVLAQGCLTTEVKADEDIPYDELLTYYRAHAAEFVEHLPRARWEQLTVRMSRFPSREAAYAALAEMGNQVLDGVLLAEVAKARSHGLTAAEGGFWDWTDKGSLRSKPLDEAIFALPVGRLSDILEDDQGFHIVRVIARQPSAMKPFADAQVEIKKKLGAQRQADARAAYIAKLRQQTPVWTSFDNDRSPESSRIDALFR